MKIEMNGYEYEQYCATWLKKHGYHNIQVTQSSNDQGIDILASKKRKRYGFQCKYYETPVGNEAVQQAFSGAAYYNCDVACVITNNTFTRSAISLAEETEVLLIDSVKPKKTSLIHQLFHLYTWFLLCTSICLLIYECGFLEYQDSTILASCFLLIASLFSIIHSHSLLHGFISLLTSLLSWILSFQYTYLIFSNILTILIFILLLMNMLRFIILCIQNQKQSNLQHQTQIDEQLHQITNEKGMKLAERITDETHYTVTYIDHEIHAQHMIYRFRSTKDISNDFPLLEYSFNQYASYANTNETYIFEKLTPKTFQIIAKHSHNIKK